MKLIREYIIFEKFKEDSDPIEDLGIGIYKLSSDFFKTIKNEYDGDPEEFLWNCLYLKDSNNEIIGVIYHFGDNASYCAYFLKPKNIFNIGTLNEVKKFLEKNKYYVIPIPKDDILKMDYFKDYPKNVNIINSTYYKMILVHNKLLKNSITEKFIEDSDPVTDLGIGFPELIKDAPKTILLEDLKHSYVVGKDKPGNILVIRIDGAYNIAKRFLILFHHGRLKNEEGKQMNRKQYAEYLVELSGISKAFSNVELRYHDIYGIVFKIKPKYQKYFRIGAYYLQNGIYTFATW